MGLNQHKAEFSSFHYKRKKSKQLNEVGREDKDEQLFVLSERSSSLESLHLQESLHKQDIDVSI